MAQAQQSGRLARWAGSALTLGLGGALLTFAALWLMQLLAPLVGDGRLAQAGSWAIFLAIWAGWALAGALGYWLLRRLGWRGGAAALAIAGWLFGYLLIWWIGTRVGGASLLVYLGFWLAFGALGGLLAGRSAPATAKAAHQARPFVRSSQFGRIPGELVLLLAQHARQATGPVLADLPRDIPGPVRDHTVRAVLDRTMRDWWANGNTEGLNEQDVADLRSFVALAASLAAGARDAETQAVYRATLGALLDDWLENWNAGGVDGPPARR